MRRVVRILLGSILVITAATVLGLIFNAIRDDGLPLFSYQSSSVDCSFCVGTCAADVTHGETSG